MKTEIQIQQIVQTAIKTISGVDASSVVVNDWAIIDGSFDKAPFYIIDVASDYSLEMQYSCEVSRWVIPVQTFIPFDSRGSWVKTYNDFSKARQDLFSLFANKTKLADGVEVTGLANSGNIVYGYDPRTEDNLIHEEFPIFVYQQMNVTIICS